MANNVLVFCEQRSGVVQKVTFELLGVATTIAQSIGGKVHAVLCGNNINASADKLITFGADTVHLVNHSSLENYLTEQYAQAVTKVVRDTEPSVVLIGATSIGRDLAPRISAKVHTGLTADCTSLAVDENGNLMMTRPAFGGNLYATIICPDHRPQMSTVRPGVMKCNEEDTSRKGEIVKVDFAPDKSTIKVELIEEVVADNSAEKIEDCSVLVSVGRGCSKQIDTYKQLASLTKGMVSCSRAVVDEGVLPSDRQVGQTGKTVRPAVYIANGISGAIQHLAGMEGSDYIIAINKDKTAPIFSVAHLGIVGDANEIITLVNKKLSQ